MDTADGPDHALRKGLAHPHWAKPVSVLSGLAISSTLKVQGSKLTLLPKTKKCTIVAGICHLYKTRPALKIKVFKIGISEPLAESRPSA